MSRRFQFSLRALLVAIVAVLVVAAFFVAFQRELPQFFMSKEERNRRAYDKERERLEEKATQRWREEVEKQRQPH